MQRIIKKKMGQVNKAEEKASQNAIIINGITHQLVTAEGEAVEGTWFDECETCSLKEKCKDSQDALCVIVFDEAHGMHFRIKES